METTVRIRFPGERSGRPGTARQAGYSLIEILLVVGVIAVVAAIAIPMTGNTLGNFRLSGDARTLSNTTTLAKMRAASAFNKSRLYVDLPGRNYHLEVWQKAPTSAWAWEGGQIDLSFGVSFSFGALAAAPPNTQATIAQAPACLAADGTAIANTACILFNSRGIPVDGTDAPTGIDAMYVTDGTAVYGVTVSATGLIRLWRSRPTTANWAQQ